MEEVVARSTRLENVRRFEYDKKGYEFVTFSKDFEGNLVWQASRRSPVRRPTI
jgi:hypothetical protein